MILKISFTIPLLLKFTMRKKNTVIILENKTFKELTLLAMQKFNIPKQNAKNVRLRGYMQYYDFLQEVYDESKLISLLEFFNYKSLSI
jgi:hypothetical protein